MTRARKSAQHVEWLYEYGLWLPGRTLQLDGEVNECFYRKALRGLTVLGDSPEPFTILLNSPGGSWTQGIAVYNAITALPNHVTIRVSGEACSMGSVILQAADHRVAEADAVLLLHDGQDGFQGHARDMERYARAGKQVRRRMYDIYAKRSGKTYYYFQNKLAHDWWLTPTEALKEGLVDEIVDA